MGVEFERLTPAIGAEVRGASESDVLAMAADGELYDRLIEHQVLIIAEPTLTTTSLLDVARSLGPVSNTHHDYQSHPEHRDVVVLEWGGEKRPDAAEWHADMTYRSSPPFASVLQAIELPPVGGDTLWASMYSAYESLPAGVKDTLAELHAVHDMGAFRTGAYHEGGNDGIAAAHQSAGSAVHPIVSHHPVTGRPYLNVSESFTRFVIGQSAPESARLLTMLFDHINRPDHQCRLRWRPGMVALWDNRATQHYAVDDYLPHRRVMHRVAVTSDPRV